MAAIKPPKAQVIEYEHSYFGKTIKDNYHWLKDQNVEKRSEIIQYLEVHMFYYTRVKMNTALKLI